MTRRSAYMHPKHVQVFVEMSLHHSSRKYYVHYTKQLRDCQILAFAEKKKKIYANANEWRRSAPTPLLIPTSIGIKTPTRSAGLSQGKTEATDLKTHETLAPPPRITETEKEGGRQSRTVVEGDEALVGDLELEGVEEGGRVVQHRHVGDVHGAHRRRRLR